MKNFYLLLTIFVLTAYSFANDTSKVQNQVSIIMKDASIVTGSLIDSSEKELKVETDKGQIVIQKDLINKVFCSGKPVDISLNYDQIIDEMQPKPAPEPTATEEETLPLYIASVDNDEFDKRETAILDWNLIQDCEGCPGKFYFNLEKSKTTDGVVYFIRLVYINADENRKYALTPNWVFINDGESLVLLIDGKRMGFKGDGSSMHRQVNENNLTEMAFYDATPAQIKKIGNAKEVKIKIIGDQYYYKAQLSDKAIKNIQRFYNEYIVKK
jgi:hypothetical protein